MPRLKLPLYGKILAWFLVNLLVVVGTLVLYIRVNFGKGLEWVIGEQAGARMELFESYMQSVLMEHPESEWPELIENFNRYLADPLPGWEPILQRKVLGEGVSFALFLPSGEQVMGRKVAVPAEVWLRLIDKRQPEERPRPGRPEHIDNAKTKPPKPRFMIRSENPTRYWSGIHSDLSLRRNGRWYPLTFVIIASDMTAGGLLFDWWPWIMVLSMGIGISALLWLPFVGSITRHIRRTNEASKRIASGQFNVRLSENRMDELGELSASVNAMAGQLGDYVSEQKRITADIAHELCSPISRMQMALGVVEQRSTPEQATYLQKLDHELQHMAKLVEEVLTFSKADALPDHEAPENFDLAELMHTVLVREAPDESLKIHIPNIELHTLRNALDRSLSNVVRNAVRYARDIEICAHVNQDQVSLQIKDRGPGVPEEAVSRLFEPFYRPEAARGRMTGGSGLGLAITKRCINACRGTVSAQNRKGGGLVVTLDFPRQLPAQPR